MEFDITALRSLATVLAFLAFIGIFWWTYSSRNKQSFDDAANIPFREHPQHSVNNEAVSTSQRGNHND
jgi:cytochrome c oxidase cbb3-type subunit 4